MHAAQPLPFSGSDCELAREDAAGAAAAAGVRVGLAEDVAALREVAEFFASVWRAPGGRPPLGVDVLRSIVHAEGAVHVARDGNRLAGACAAIFRPPAARGAYSLIAAAGSPDRGVGFALKLAQRAWAADLGATSIRWTFDPLVSRNARFNLVKLGAVAVGYAVDFYGPLDDGIDTNDETDRLTVDWALAGKRGALAGTRGTVAVAGTRGALTGSRQEEPAPEDVPDLARAELDLRRAPDGGPLAAREEDARWCRVPGDIVTIRRRDPELATQWRGAVRAVLGAAFADGFRATGMSRDGWYRLTRGEAR